MTSTTVPTPADTRPSTAIDAIVRKLAALWNRVAEGFIVDVVVDEIGI